MNIDDDTCRGSLVLLRGEWYVVISRPASLYLKCILRKDVYHGYIAEYQYITAETEVEMVFPGCAYVLPNYIQ